MNPSLRSKQSKTSRRTSLEEISARVGEEVINGRFEPGTWARALASVKGNREDAVAVYAKRRILDLTKERTTAAAKHESLEKRRLRACYGVKTVQDILKGMGGSSKAMNLPRPRLPMMGVLLLMLGTTGSFAALTKLSIITVPAGLHHWIPLIALGVGFSTAVATKMLGLVLPPFTLRWVWGHGLIAACAATCIASMLLGAKLMSRNPDDPTLYAVITKITPGLAHREIEKDVGTPAKPIKVVLKEDPRKPSLQAANDLPASKR